MLLPFTSYAWTTYAGKYGETMLHVYVDVPNSGIDAAKQLKKRLKGHRCMLFQNADFNLFHNSADRPSGATASLWWPHGIADCKANFTTLIGQIKAAGADLDAAIFDNESGISSYSFNEASLAAIYADPRYAALAASGNFPADCRNMSEADRMLFNYGCVVLRNAATKQALIDPLYAKYPGVAWCNFGDVPLTKADSAKVPDLNNHQSYLPKSDAPFYAPVAYGSVGQITWGDARLKQPYYALAYSMNQFRAAYRADPAAKLLPWIAPRPESNVLDLPHWTELVYHTCCLAGPRVLFFNASDFSALANWRFDSAVGQYIGQAKGKVWSKTVTTDLTSYDDNAIVSAARLVDGSTVGRVTFKSGVNSVTVQVAGKSVTVKKVAGTIGTWFRY